MDKKSPGKLNTAEMRIYEFLGVRTFRKAVIFLEKIRHRKDGGINENYHPDRIDVPTLNGFTGYLLYNSLFHVISILIAVIYFSFLKSAVRGALWTEIVMIILTLLNVYCIMLQRYIFLRMKRFLHKSLDKNERRMNAAWEKIRKDLDEKSAEDFAEEYDLVKKLFDCTYTGMDCIIDSKCAGVIERIASIAEKAGATGELVTQKCFPDKPLAEAVSEITANTYVTSRIEKNVSGLQKLLKTKEHDNVSFGYSIIVEDEKCENAFRRLFPVTYRDRTEFTVTFLMTAYQRKAEAGE